MRTIELGGGLKLKFWLVLSAFEREIIFAMKIDAESVEIEYFCGKLLR